MPYAGIFGLCYYHEHRFVSLPLLNVHADASIKELAAQVKLTQTYSNDAVFAIEATYMFPIPARAAVCSFVMIKQDGTRVVGIVQEKQEARETYDAAVAAGQQASLLEQQTPDVFQVSVGNIAPKEEVQIELVYATELAEDEESDSIRFHLPVHIGSRYGHGPDVPSSHLISQPVDLFFIPVRLPHSGNEQLGPDPKLPNFKELPFSNYARVSLSSDSMLDKDFVLAVKSAGLDAPRCIAELHPTDNTLAMGLTLVPRFKLPDVSRQEFVLLVDRSGSMKGKRIEAAKKALVVMLRAIPHKDSLFQIMSFGSRSSSLWPQGSKPYNQETLEEATRHVDSMQADYGGTEIRAALSECFRARKTDRPLSVLMLTDGDAWDVDGVLAECKAAVEGAPKNAYIRISVLGIGNAVSTAMCEGIARVGNGTCMLVGEEEASFTGKISRMLKAAKSPPISDITVDWGQPASSKSGAESKEDDDEDDFEIIEKAHEKKKLNIFDESIDDPMVVDSTPAPPAPPVVLAPPPYVQQAPYNPESFPKYKTIPKTVTIRGSTVDGAEIELPIPVTISYLQNAPGAPPAVHALAARKLIQDLEDGRHDVAKTLKNPDDSDLLARTVKAMIVRLGKTYSIASTHTSFVAVDESKPNTNTAPVVVRVAAVEQSRQSASKSMKKSMNWMGMGMSMPAPTMSMSIGGGFGSPPTQPSRRKSSASVGPTTTAYSALHSYGGVPQAAGPAKSAPSYMGRARMIVESLPPPLFEASPVTASYVDSMMDAVPLPPSDMSRRKASVPTTGGAPRRARLAQSGTLVSDSAPAPAPTSSDPLEALARLQAFDGCFSLEVLNVIKLAPSTDIQAVRAALPSGVSDAIVATLLAMAFLANKLGAGVERDAWEGMYEKAEEYVEGALQAVGATEKVEVLVGKINPDADERSQAERAVHKKWLEISELDGVIGNLHSALLTLQSRHATLVSELLQLQTALAPIRRLPPEILAEIFLYFQPYMPPIADERWSGIEPPWMLGLVCRSWREIALGLGRLWSVLDVGNFNGRSRHEDLLMRLSMHEYDDAEFRTTSQQEALEELEGFEIECALETLQACLIRSKNHGLSIRLWTTESTLGMLLLELLLNYADRWEEVILLGPSDATCLRIEQQDLPRLRKLALVYNGRGDNFYDPWGTPPLGHLALSAKAPQLTKLTLKRVHVSDRTRLPVPWSDLQQYCELRCGFAPSYRLAVYSQLKQLVTMHIGSTLPMGDVWGMHVVFPNLRVASFRFHELATLAAMVPIAFEMPALEEYNVEGQNINRFSVCIPRGSSLLRKLSVHFAHAGLNPGDTEDMLECFPALTEVSLWGPNYFTEECLERLTPSIDREPLLPQLQILRLSSTSFVHGYCKWTTFLSMLCARFVPPTPAVRHLHTLEFLYDIHGSDENVESGLVNLRRQRGWNIQVKTERVNPVWTDFTVEWPV
ncbi:von Willebrand factor type A domain-containing protein [Mycena amicta]|nr:von Willebrand factor type A domain-containing protein [Mycena amicta]